MKINPLSFWNSLSIRKKIISLVLVAAIAAIGLQIFGNRSVEQTSQATQGEIEDVVLVSGNVLSNGQTPVYTTTTGVISSLYVANGQSVQKGDALFAVTSTASEPQKQAAYAAYLNAVSTKNASDANKITLQSQLEEARQAVIDASQDVDTMTNNRNVSKPNPATGLPYTQNEIDSINSALVSARQNFSAIEKQFLSADAGISAASANAASALVAYQATQNSTLYAPVSGIVANIAYTQGDKVTASAQEPGGQTIPVLVLADFSRTLIKTSVNEVDVARIAPGQKVRVTFDAIPSEIFNGEVLRVDSIGQNNQGVITYAMYLFIDSLDPRIKTGMTSNVSVIVKSMTDAVLIPNTAIVAEGNDAVVYVSENGKWTKRNVTIGIKNSTDSQVLDGIAVGETVRIAYVLQ